MIKEYLLTFTGFNFIQSVPGGWGLSHMMSRGMSESTFFIPNNLQSPVNAVHIAEYKIEFPNFVLTLEIFQPLLHHNELQGRSLTC